MPRNSRRSEQQVHWLRLAGVILCYGGLIYLSQGAGEWALSQLEVDLRPGKQAMIHRVVMATAALYIVLLAIPFMPGVEIGLGLMFLFGPDICFLVYLSTLTALTLSFAIGRLIPPPLIASAFRWLGLVRAADLVSKIGSLSAEERLPYLAAKAPVRFLSFFLKHRYLALAVMVNLPGNAVIGGGGGIALAAGASRIFGTFHFIAAMALAVSPIPLAYYFIGSR